MKFKPNGYWVVLPDPRVTQTESGIFLGEDSSAKQAMNSNVLEVLAVGPMCTFVKVGDIVTVDPRIESLAMEKDGKEILMVAEHDLLGKAVEEEDVTILD